MESGYFLKLPMVASGSGCGSWCYNTARLKLVFPWERANNLYHQIRLTAEKSQDFGENVEQSTRTLQLVVPFLLIFLVEKKKKNQPKLLRASKGIESF